MIKKNKKSEDLIQKLEQNLIKDNNKSLKQLENEFGMTQIGDTTNREDRIKQYGTNVKDVRKFNGFKEFFGSLFEPFNILLIVIGLVELFLFIFYKPDGKRDTLELVSSIIVFAMVLLAAITDFIQEYLSYKNTTKLLKMIENTVYIITAPIKDINNINNHWIAENTQNISDVKLTKGDAIYLNTGDIVPADLKIIWSEDLYVDQSTLTGESDPIYKSSISKTNSNNIFNTENLLISETTIIKGKCIGLVLNVGENTYSNQIIKIATDKNDETDYEMGLKKVTKLILFSILGFFPILFIITGLRTGEWVSAIIFAISMVVSLTPESLPAMISSNIQVGSKRMAKNDIVVKNFKCIQNLGSTTVIATDKTGTLTTGNLNVINYIDINSKKTEEIIDLAFLNSFYQNNMNNQIDSSIIYYGEHNKLDINHDDYKLLASKEFNFETRITSILIENKDGNKIQVTKGAPQEIIDNSSYIKENNIIRKINKNDLLKMEQCLVDSENQGKKVLAIAIKENVSEIEDNNLIYLGSIIFENQIKDGVKEIINIFNKFNLKLKVLTGDSPIVSERVGQEIKLPNTKTISGIEFESVDEDTKKAYVEAYGIFAKLNPLEKAEVISYLHKDKEVVTYLGDGINDVPALKKADVGITVNNGSAVAKATSDVILLKKDLRILESAIIEGRKIFTNAIKFIKIIVTLNFGLLMTLLISSIWLDFNAMSPIQLLIQNLIYDFMGLAFVFDNVDENYIKKPKSWDPKSILIFGVFNGIVPILISITNFLIVGYGFDMFANINSTSGNLQMDYIHQFQTAFFLESLMTHILLIVVYRTNEVSLFQSRPSWELTTTLIFFMGLGFLFAYTPGVYKTFGFNQINNYWLFAMVGYIPVIWCLGEISKYSYIKIFNKWI